MGRRLRDDRVNAVWVLYDGVLEYQRRVHYLATCRSRVAGMLLLSSYFALFRAPLSDMCHLIFFPDAPSYRHTTLLVLNLFLRSLMSLISHVCALTDTLSLVDVHVLPRMAVPKAAVAVTRNYDYDFIGEEATENLRDFLDAYRISKPVSF